MFPNSYPGPGLLGKLNSASKSISWSTLIDGTQKTLNVINQAIPLFYQIKPLFNNAKVLFKIASGVSSLANDKVDTNVDTDIEKSTTSETKNTSIDKNISNKPVFYI